MDSDKSIIARSGPPDARRDPDVIVAGAGAAGLFCAMTAASRGLNVELLEAGPEPGRKLAASGGGKANFSNRLLSPASYLCRPEPGFCAPALETFGVGDILKLLRRWRLPFEEREHGRLFLTVSASRLVAALVNECLAHDCRISSNTPVESAAACAGGFEVKTGRGSRRAQTLVLALGTPARPGLGGVFSGWNLAASLGHAVSDAVPGLTPLLYGEEANSSLPAELAGISVSARVFLAGDKQPGAPPFWDDSLLFTHSGLSGPAILRASLYWTQQTEIVIDFLPGLDFEAMLDNAPRKTPRSISRELLPARLVDALLPRELGMRKNAEISRRNRGWLASRVHAFRISGMKPAGLNRAEVCSGGVSCDEINPSTMESRLWPGLHIIGEMLDVTGDLGGYNLHWAFASAFCAGQCVSRFQKA